MNDPVTPRGFRLGESQPSSQRTDSRALLDALRALRRAGLRQGLWPEFCRCAALLCRAQAAICIAEADGVWGELGNWQAEATGLSGRWNGLASDLAERLGDKGFAVVPAGQGINAIAVGIRLSGAGASVLVLEIPEAERPRLNELILRAQLVADIPRSDAGEISGIVKAGSPVLAGADGALVPWLEIALQVTRHKRFGPAALALVNGIAAKTGWSQVCLGWRRGPYIQVRAISHLDRFERRADYVRLLEAAMEEALDHDGPVHDPAPGEPGPISAVAHSRLRQGLGYQAVLTLPLKGESDSTEAVLLLAHEFPDPPAISQDALELALHMMMPWLAPLDLSSRWFGARWAHQLSEFAIETLRINQLGRKAGAMAVAGLLLYGIFGTWPHRVDANAELVTDSTQLLNAPFDGFVDQVLASSGDTVRQGGVLAILDRQELLLQESEIRAEIRRFTSESEKARAAAQAADVQIALARRAQSQARLERINFLLEQSRIMAPFDGVIIEGERRELLGAPVRRGDRIFRIARVEGLYVTLFVPESDMRFISPDARGEISLLSQPDRNHPIQIEAVIPVAQVKPQTGNLFMIRARLIDPPEAWWRPGMTGLARIDAGDRNILWLISRRAMDTLRLKLWW
jgi:multidrug resistance efflux pump